jgi:hypothetical protein
MQTALREELEVLAVAEDQHHQLVAVLVLLGKDLLAEAVLIVVHILLAVEAVGLLLSEIMELLELQETEAVEQLLLYQVLQ